MAGTLSAKDVRQGFSDCVSRVAFGKERIVITRNRKGMVALVPLEDFDLLEQLEDRMLLDQARGALIQGGPASTWSAVRSELRW